MSRITSIFFDFGGVIADSPFANLSRYERERGLPADFIRLTNADNPDDNAWACFERGEIDLDEFDRRFRTETLARGHEVPGRDLIPLLQVEVRPAMITLLDQLRGNGLRLACLTNNLPVGDGALNFEIVDVAVDPQYQGQGLGRIVMQNIMQYLNENAPEGAYITLLADVPELYKKFGFVLSRPECEGMHWQPNTKN